MLNGISQLIASVSLTPEKLAVDKSVSNGAANTTSSAAILQVDNAPNLFALQSLINIDQSQETLLDPTNNAGATTQSDVYAIGQIAASYATAAQPATQSPNTIATV